MKPLSEKPPLTMPSSVYGHSAMLEQIMGGRRVIHKAHQSNSKILITRPYARPCFSGGVSECRPHISIKAMIGGECVQEMPMEIPLLDRKKFFAEEVGAWASVMSLAYGLEIQNNLEA